jgi:5,10-methylenetetrahydromethanopterin reductase
MSLGFDFCFVPRGPISHIGALAGLADELGFRCMWIPDQGFRRDPFVLYAAAANASRTIDLGIGITSPITRHPVQIARVAATLDEFSGGRLRLGLGSGNIPKLVRPMGMPTDRLVGRVREGLAAVRTLLAGDAVRFAGPEDAPEAVRLEFSPREGIPFYIGARGPQMLTLAGRYADGVLIESLFNEDGLPHALDRIGKGAHAGRRTLDAIDVVSWQVAVVTEQPEAVIDANRPWIAHLLYAGPREALLRVGVDEETLDLVTQAMERGAVEDALGHVTDAAVRCLMLVGTPNELIQRISEIGRRGANTISIVGTGSLDEAAANLLRFAREVMPAFAGEQASRSDRRRMDLAGG